MNKLRTSAAAKAAAYLILILSSLTALLALMGVGVALQKNYFFLSPEGVDAALQNYDLYSRNLYWFIYNYREVLILLATAGTILSLLSLAFLLTSAGHKKNREGLQKGLFTDIPLDLLSLLAFCLLIFILLFGDTFNTWELLVYFFFAYPVSVLIAAGFLVDLALRIKLGRIWENTLIWRFWKLLIRTGKKLMGLLSGLIASLPLLWKAILFMVVLSLLELFFVAVCDASGDAVAAILFLWLGEKTLLYPALLFLILILRKLQVSGRELAQGNLTHHTDTSKLFWEFKEHGENLNSIALGMSRAVEDRLKSERMKTELITNVSHDIKTPLTSIINYSDLIANEEFSNEEQLKEYAAALHRQSERLKKLLEDLLDASRVSTGNVEIHLSPCETDVLLTQAVGEYEERLKELELELIVKPPQKPLTILVDGRHIWRIFDNLMNNVCKYAQSGTRVYLTLEEKENQAVFSLKNTSHQPLDLSADELMERFVRGDRSRHTEGSGLGLSIAQSLTLLQKGDFSLMIDGDFFKVTLSFPLFL